MPENKHLRFMLWLFYVLLSVACAYVVFRYAVPLFLPFIIGFIVSRIISRPVKLVSSKLHVPQRVSSAVFTLLTYFVVGFLIYALSASVIAKFRDFFGILPSVFSSAASKVDELLASLNSYMFNMPEKLSGAVSSLVSMIKNGVSIPSGAYTGVLGGITKSAKALPTVLISVIATVVSTYFISSDGRNAAEFFKKRVPERFAEAVRRTYEYLTVSLGHWLRAQLLLIFITFAELLIGFIIMRLDYAAVLAALIAVIDALPILGVGTVLIPWGLLSLLSGSVVPGVTLLIIYGVVAIVRNSIEPKIVGERIGLSPLATLICMYAGLRLFGFFGMFLIPLVTITVIQLAEWGYITVNPFKACGIPVPDDAEDVNKDADIK